MIHDPGVPDPLLIKGAEVDLDTEKRPGRSVFCRIKIRYLRPRFANGCANILRIHMHQLLFGNTGVDQAFLLF